MAYQIQLKLKDGTVRTDFSLNAGQTPKVGEQLTLNVSGKPIRVKVTATRPMPMHGTDLIEVVEV